jgi:hypothetical protein
MVTSTTHRARPLLDVRTWAWLSGWSGVAAGILLVLFFALADPFGTAEPVGGWTWTGPANDVAVALQFATFVPVAWALRGRLPATRAVRAGTVAAVIAMVAAAVLQVLLVAGVIPFETQLPFVMVAFVVVFGWLLGADFAAHRSRTLPRPLTRVGLLLGAGFIVGMLLAAAGLLLPGPAGQVVLWLGLGVGSVAWLALPAFPLLLARYVFTKERS